MIFVAIFDDKFLEVFAWPLMPLMIHRNKNYTYLHWRNNECQWSVCIQLNDHYARKSGNKAILHVITVRKIGCQQMWQRTGRDFLYFHLSPVTAYRSSSKSSRIIANTNRVLWRTLQLERFLTLVVSADLRIWWSCCCFLKQSSNSKRRLSIYYWFVLYSFDIIFILFILK